ncbi:DNA polymerase IV [Salegentibacter mishustinae]|uniref:DNA polymerase IV n=1 Tax=Salegentibacter mishustinae TaxID=270918 RepID=A0A0Q9Z7T7_9FLAO|nr:DNA polymerase IV [Salegentibacter mishustinae]KRG28992.1 DNA polymerase IV [Salegentibacter mishustinae]PNW21956.1 DNA polymerase IV [Salegentibacter mishustinae]PZX65311.1 DNA polymerase-4 [Salegentibacter mishustinae]GGW85916.1 DNA polymerase IV [Salegentibacter mishustinae]
MKNKSILHLDLDAFFVSVERKQNSELNGKPLIVGGIGDRGVVAACSYETRKFGVHSGMAMKVARQLCPQATVIKGNASTYTKHSKEVTEIIKSQVPSFEKASVDEFYADLSGMDKFFGINQFASELRQTIIKESGLPISFGLSQNKVVSKIATGEAKPNAEIIIPHGNEKIFLAPLSVNKIPMVGNKTFQKLLNLGVREIKTIQEMPVEMLESVLGKAGRTIWKRANGLDDTPIIPYHERKSISTERTFGRDTIDMVRLHATLVAMAESLAYQLRRGNKLTSVISVKIRYSDYQTHSKQVKISYTSADHILIPKVEMLFKQLYSRRLLIRLIGVKFSGLVGGNYQINLFDDSEEMLNLYNSIDKIKERFGEHSVMRAVTMGTKTIGRMGNPFNGEPPIVLAHRKQ